jgi:hypothetical protein
VAPFGPETAVAVVPPLLVFMSGSPKTVVALMPLENGAENMSVLLLPVSAT